MTLIVKFSTFLLVPVIFNFIFMNSICFFILTHVCCVRKYYRKAWNLALNSLFLIIFLNIIYLSLFY